MDELSPLTKSFWFFPIRFFKQRLQQQQGPGAEKKAPEENNRFSVSLDAFCGV